jgi:hypothetical protein
VFLKFQVVTLGMHPMTMRFCGHVPNPSRNNNLKTYKPHLLKRMDLWLSKTWLSTLGISKNNFFLQL